MNQVYVVAFPDGTYLDKDGEKSSFFFCEVFDSHDLAMEFAIGNLDYGICFRIDTIYTKTAK